MTANDATPATTDQPLVKNNLMTDWEQLTLATKNAFYSGDHSAVLDHSSPIVDDLQKKLVYILKMRVVSWSHTVNCAQELKEASTLIQYAPHDPAGYLSMGHRYADQGYQTKAIKVFKDGLNNVSRDNAQYNELYDARQRAVNQRNTKIDIVANVPFDVMGLIAEQIPPETLPDCLLVSQVWKRKLSTYPGCWRNIRFNEFKQIFDTISLPPSIYYTLPVISHHIRSLSLPHCPQVISVLEKIATMKFSSLQSFEVRRPPCPYDGPDCYPSLRLILPNIAGSLTSLDVSLFSDQPDILYQILNTCRNLTTLRFCNEARISSSDLLALSHRTFLRKLVLEGDECEKSDLVHLFQCSPDIRYLALDYWHDDLCAAVNEHCRNISVVRLTNRLNRLSDFDHVDSKHCDGLTSFHALNPTSTHTMAPLIESHSATLRRLSINFDEDLQGWAGRLSSFSLHNLTDLELHWVPEAITNELASILAGCPRLESISLRMFYEAQIPTGTFRAISNLKRLASLEISEVDIPTSEEKSLLHFLHGAQLPQKGKSELKRLRLNECVNSSAVVIACSAITTLNDLSISLSDIPDDLDEQVFAAGLGCLPNLEKLRLKNFRLSEHDLLRIGDNKSLKEIDLLRGIYYLTKEEIRRAFSPKVKLL